MNGKKTTKTIILLTDTYSLQSGTAAGYTCTNFIVKPQVGDFYVFPSQLFHCVYPFYTKGERRSFSMNMNFLEVPKEKSVDK